MSPPIDEGNTAVLDRPAADTNVSDPFNFDITFIENVPASESLLMCSTGDNCGTSCGSACVTS